MRIDKNELAGKISQLKGIVPTRTKIEALKGILYKDGYLIASDMNLTVKARIDIMEDLAEKTDPFIIPEQAFDLISSLPSGEMELKVGDGQVAFQIGRIKNHFRTLPAEQFAYDRGSIASEGMASIPADKLKAAISHVLYAVAVDSHNKAMTGMFMECKEGKLNFVGLDGHRIAWDSIDYSGDFRIIVPKAAAEKLLKLDFTGDISILHDENGVLFRTDDYEVYTRLVQGEFFKYEGLFAGGSLFTVIERRAFLDAINRVRLCRAAEDRTPVIFDMADASVKVSYQNSMAEYSEDIAVQQPFTAALRIGFNPKLLIDSLKAFDCENVSMEFSSAKHPVIMKASNGGMTSLVLPVNIG